MIKICKNNETYHIIHKKADFSLERCDISDKETILQVSSMKLPIKSFQAHQHLPLNRKTNTTQECWIVIEGKLRVDYYDEVGQLLDSYELLAGDCTITFKGGHNYHILESDTLVYEVKNGPYLGRDRDKTLI